MHDKDLTAQDMESATGRDRWEIKRVALLCSIICRDAVVVRDQEKIDMEHMDIGSKSTQDYGRLDCRWEVDGDSDGLQVDQLRLPIHSSFLLLLPPSSFLLSSSSTSSSLHFHHSAPRSNFYAQHPTLVDFDNCISLHCVRQTLHTLSLASTECQGFPLSFNHHRQHSRWLQSFAIRRD